MDADAERIIKLESLLMNRIIFFTFYCLKARLTSLAVKKPFQSF